MNAYIIILMLMSILAIFISQIVVANKNERKYLDNEIKSINEFKRIENNDDDFSYHQKYKRIQDIYSNKGKVEEYNVFKKIKDELEGSFEIFGPAYISNKNNEKDTTEIDITVIHKVGIFIIEVKNLYGEITGEINEQYWNQKLDIKTEHDFYNPVLQNKGHIYNFKKIIDINKYNLENSDIYSIIVFGDESMINNVRYEEDNLKIVNTRQVIDILNKIIRNKEDKLSDNDIQKISCIYKSRIKSDDETEEKHINSINAKRNQVIYSKR